MAWGFGDQPQLSIKWALALCYFVGFRGKRLVSAVAVMTAESNRYPGAFHENLSENGTVLSVDRGLFQINDFWHPSLSDEDAYKPIPNAAYAYDLSNRGEFWSHWAAYGGVRYLLVYAEVLAVWALRKWLTRVTQVPVKFE
jgi:hypothetical protein